MRDKLKTGRLRIGAAALCLAASCAAAAGELIVVPVSASASSFYDSKYAPQWMVNGSGLTGLGRDATHTNANSQNLFWHSALPIVVSEQWVEFDLGSTYNVTNALVWQLAQTNFTTRGVKVFAIKVAGADHAFSTYSPSNLLNQATASPNTPVQVVPLVAGNVRYVRFEIQSNWGAAGIVGLSEVRFEVAPFEPNTAEETLAPVSATASSNYGPQPYQYGPQWLINGAGLTGTGRTATHTNANAVNLLWHSNTNTVISAQWVEFDLGSPRDVVNALVWQLAQQNLITRGVKAFTIKVAGPDHVFSTVSTNNLLAIASGLASEPVRIVPLAAKNIRYVRFDIQSNWGSGEVVGLSEVRFEAIPPETNATFRATVNNAVSSYYYLNPKAYLIDGSGLTGTGLSATHTNALGQTSMWLSGKGLVTNEWVEFDFGWEIELVSAAIWQYNQTATDTGAYKDFTPRGVKGMTILTAGAGKSYTEYGSVVLNRAGGTAAEPVQLVHLAAEKVRYVKFAVNSNWGDSDMVGLSEVRFLYKPAGTLIRLF